MISEDSSSLRRAGFEDGVQPHPRSSSQARPHQPGSHQQRGLDPGAFRKQAIQKRTDGPGRQAGRGPGAHHSSLERLFGQLCRQTWGGVADLAVVPREKPHTGAAAREQPRDSPVIER